MPRLKRFQKFSEMVNELKKSGAAVFVDPASTEDLVVLLPYRIDYLNNYAEDSKFFLGLEDGKLLGSECTNCGRRYGTPRGHCLECGNKTHWIELPLVGTVHSWTTCYFGSEEFLSQTPFNLALVEFESADTLFLSRLTGVKQEDIFIGMKVRANFRKVPKYTISDVYFTPEKA